MGFTGPSVPELGGSTSSTTARCLRNGLVGKRSSALPGKLPWQVKGSTCAEHAGPQGERRPAFRTLAETMAPGPTRRPIDLPLLPVADFGAFLEIAAGLEGLVYLSELRDERVENAKGPRRAGSGRSCLHGSRGGDATTCASCLRGPAW